MSSCWRNYLWNCCAVVPLLFAASCAQHNLGVGARVVNCCDTDYSHYTTFELSVAALPMFLKPIVEEELTRALQGRGLVPGDLSSDLVVQLNLVQVDLGESVERDPFQGRLDPGGEMRFLADLKIELLDRASGELVWSGVVSRIHDIVPGETMPLARAQAAIGAAFSEVLAGYPMRPQ